MTLNLKQVTPDPCMKATCGILREKDFFIVSDARRAAEYIMEEARKNADATLTEADIAAQKTISEIEKSTLERANLFLNNLRDMNDRIVTEAEPLVIELAQAVFSKLISQTTPKERIEAMLRQVMKEAPRNIVAPMLRIHPDDIALLPQTIWEVKADTALKRGMCRLEANQGEWHADFETTLDALSTIFMKNSIKTNQGPKD